MTHALISPRAVEQSGCCEANSFGVKRTLLDTSSSIMTTTSDSAATPTEGTVTVAGSGSPPRDPPPLTAEQTAWLRATFGPPPTGGPATPVPSSLTTTGSAPASSGMFPMHACYYFKPVLRVCGFAPASAPLCTYPQPRHQPQPARLQPARPFPQRAAAPNYHYTNCSAGPLVPPPLGSLSVIPTFSASAAPLLPTFTPANPPQVGLDLFATVASAASDTPHAVSAKMGITQHGPYNPAASLPPKVVRKILDLEFVEMTEITLDDFPSSTAGHPPLPARPPIQDISVWLERYSIMAALLSSRFPEKAPELFAYQASIVRAERNYDDRRWVAYDRRYRREALAQKDLNWSVPNARLYNEAFTGRARAIPRCTYCLQEDHTAQYCPRNPHRPWFGWLPDPSSWPQGPPRPKPTPARAPQQQETCRRFNEGRCRSGNCRYSHRCLDCGGPHPRTGCPGNQQGNMFRARSPHRPGQQQPASQAPRY